MRWSINLTLPFIDKGKGAGVLTAERLAVVLETSEWLLRATGPRGSGIDLASQGQFQSVPGLKFAS
jgi:hypothetical protein